MIITFLLLTLFVNRDACINRHPLTDLYEHCRRNKLRDGEHYDTE